MKKKFLKKIIAQSEKDLQFVSACCSDGLVEINEIKTDYPIILKNE